MRYRTLTIGGKIKLFRRQRGLTVGAASKECRVPEKNWERYEAGQNAPSAAHLLRILKRWDINLDAVEPEDCE